MWLGKCWGCHVGDTATNMTLALWMWNNTWQAELLISNHLLSWYASGNCCTTVFFTTLSLYFGSSPRQMLSIGEKSLLPLMHSSKNCPTESDSAFLRLFSICALLEHILNNSSSTHVYNLSGAWQVCTFSSSRISFPWREHISGTCRTSRDGRLLMWYQIILFLIVPRGWCSC